MASPALTRPAAIGVPWWSVVLAVVGVALVYLVLQENGLVLAANSEVLHEFFHDGRHALGVPCH